jgi:hypothetical protein
MYLLVLKLIGKLNGGKYMAVTFFDVKEREKVDIQDNEICKTKYERKLKDGRVQVRYAFRAKTKDGRSLTKFCTKSDWDGVSAPEEK